MVKFILKIGILFLILLIVFSGLNYIYKDFYFFEKTINEYENLEDNIDVVILGSSHAHQSYDIRLIESELGLRGFNFGNSAQRIEITEMILDKVLSENNLKLIVVDIFSMTIDGANQNGPKRLQLKTLDYLPSSLTKIRKTNQLFDNNYFFYALNPFFRNHYKWKEINALSFSREFKLQDKNEFYNGFKVPTRSFNNKTWNRFLKKHSNHSNAKNFKDLSQEEKGRIQKIIKVAKDKNIPLLFVNSPSYVNDYYKKYQKTTSFIKSYIENQGLNFVDFDNLRKNKSLTKEDFADPNHLNSIGGIKVTDSLINYIKSNYTFKLGNSEKAFEKNKFYHINNNFYSTKIFNKINSESRRFKSGIVKVAVIKSSENRLEIILETNNKEEILFKSIIKLSDEQLSHKFEKDVMEIKNKKLYNWGVLNKFNSFTLGNKTYKSYQFYYPFDYIENIQIFIGNTPKVKILNKSNIQLKIK